LVVWLLSDLSPHEESDKIDAMNKITGYRIENWFSTDTYTNETGFPDFSILKLGF
jgi:hypothetical protein